MYTKRIVAFIDILGFKHLVDQNNFEKVDKVLSIFEDMINKSNERNLMFTDDKDNFKSSEQNLSFFSDCVIWTYPYQDQEEQSEHYKFLLLKSLIGLFFVLQHSLFTHGILIRGGVTIGNIYQSKSRVFGPALVKAYSLENKAKYPRFAFDNIFLRGIDLRVLKLLKHDIRFSYNRQLFYLDIFNQLQLINTFILNSSKESKILEKTILPMYLEPLVKIIKENKDAHSNPRIQAKFNWMEKKIMSIKNLQYPLEW